MNRLAIAICISLGCVTPSLATDWNGIYIGAHFANEWGHLSVNMNQVPDFKTSGFSGGPQFMGIYQTKYPFALGVIADLDIGNIKGSTNLNGIDIYFSRNLKASLRGIVGYIGFEEFMPYITAGLGFQKNNVSIDMAYTFPAKQIQTGYVFGAGAMFSLARFGYPNASIYGEYLLYDFPVYSHAITPGFNIPIKSDEKMIKAGINFRM